MDELIDADVTTAVDRSDRAYKAKLDELRRSLPTPTRRPRTLDFRTWSKSLPVSIDADAGGWRLAEGPRRLMYEIRQASKAGELMLYSCFVHYESAQTTGTLAAPLFTTPVMLDAVSGCARPMEARSVNTELVDRLVEAGIDVDLSGEVPKLSGSSKARLDGPDRIAEQAQAALPPAAYLDHVSHPAILTNELLRFFVAGSASEPSASPVAGERPRGRDHSVAGLGGSPASDRDEVEPSEQRPQAVPIGAAGAIALDDDQRAACTMALQSRACFIQGPPGTGKSQVIAALAELAAADGRSVLVTSTERSAIDVARRRAGHIPNARIMTLDEVAQMVPATIGDPDFDVVVIDEASRMALASAATAIVRARSVVIIGDDRQLKPEGGLKTILDVAIEMGLPRTTLRFHYRSKDRTLITLSNLMSYDMKLRTVPTPLMAPTSGLKLAYMTGKETSTPQGTVNRQEAAFVIQTLKDLAKEMAARSIAVITANTAQAALIQRTITSDLSEQQKAALSRVMGEPLLVRAAQAMQGEERDVILASMVYDGSSGRFGGFDKDDGINVANVMMSRSKEEMTVLMSYRPTARGMAIPSTRGKIIYSFLYSCMDVAATTETRQKTPACFSALAKNLGMRIDHLGVVLGLRSTMDDRYRLGLIPVSASKDAGHWDSIEAQLTALGWTVMRLSEERCRTHQAESAASIRELLAAEKSPRSSRGG